jgi:glycosyltransferase involved in cell wall biosynthesis
VTAAPSRERATRPRSAIVQDWFFAPGGAEQVALEFAELLPDAEVYTTFADPSIVSSLGRRLHTWPLQRVFAGTRSFRRFLPLYPLWFGALDLRAFDLVISSSSAFAKAVRTRPGALHIAYVHTPMRYAWDLEGYLGGSSFSRGSRVGAQVLRPWLRRWDRSTSARPDVLIANSETVRSRIRRFWGRDAEVIHPPVPIADISVSDRDDGYLLVVARLLAYRRIDLVVDAATRLGRSLIVIGDGPEAQRLRSRAGAAVRFLGTVDRRTVVDHLERCHAYVVPGEEDFGMAPVEAMAAGKPVIGLKRGGVTETVIDGTTGVLFDQPTIDSISDAIERLDGIPFDRAAIRARAEAFDPSVFRRRWRELLERLGVDPAVYSRA